MRQGLVVAAQRVAAQRDGITGCLVRRGKITPLQHRLRQQYRRLAGVRPVYVAVDVKRQLRRGDGVAGAVAGEPCIGERQLHPGREHHRFAQLQADPLSVVCAVQSQLRLVGKVVRLTAEGCRENRKFAHGVGQAQALLVGLERLR